MHIVYVVTKGMPLGGGIEKYTEELGSRLVERGHRVTVYAMRHYGAENGEYRGMRIKTVPTVKIRFLEKLLAAFNGGLKSCFEGADIVHFHAFGPAMWCFLPRLVGTKVVTQGHGLEWKRSRWGKFGRTFLKTTEAPSVRWANAVTAVSKVQQQYILEKYGLECTYIPTGVTPPEIVPPAMIQDLGLEGGDYILFAARLVREKGVHHLIEAFRKLDTDKKLVIAGDAPFEESYKAELHRLANNDPRILFPGFVTGQRLCELFSNCYLFVLPSELEGLPIALLEAMSYGACCLASDIPENIEALNDIGYTFHCNDPEDLRIKLEMLLSDKEKVSRYKDLSKEYVQEKHTWDSIADRFESFYLGVLEGKHNA